MLQCLRRERAAWVSLVQGSAVASLLLSILPLALVPSFLVRRFYRFLPPSLPSLQWKSSWSSCPSQRELTILAEDCWD